MIKIPGTPEGLPAIEEALFRGINVNVTLLFSVEDYSAVLEAWLRGLERRHEAGLDLKVESVASFFVSRVDSEVDKRLAGTPHEAELRGTAAVANARAAFQRYLEVRGGERFAALEAAGARPQRPLWASTGVKDPAYSTTKYVDALIAPETVNTMPLATSRPLPPAPRSCLARPRSIRPTTSHGSQTLGSPSRRSPTCCSSRASRSSRCR